MQKPTHTALLTGKTAVVTGAASGIGLAIATAFARHGARVCLVDINEPAAHTAAAKIGTAAQAFPCDVSDSAVVHRAFETILALGPIHILVNNAGVAHVGTLASTTEADFDRLLRVNVRGVYLCTRAVLEPMKQNGGGVILNMASIAGMAGLPDRFAYSTTKGAVLAMTYSIARDYLADKIRCNAISPARVHTPFVDGFVAKNYPGRESEMMEKLGASQPVGRMALPEEVASLATWLCSDEAAFVTGTNYPLDGGYINLRG
ncbi:MAG TPA: SDR family oxidoreductase [Acidobacteriaceae bacterium]|jgi:NAD(P)-dependent dehydrogenase (short-subunit alcohol dehydrogenase family)|nr:SDR family oxidoreductase [Acidobacteriaceae bacterium]